MTAPCSIRRDIFLKIEPVTDYSPLAPELCARHYGRDCQFNEGHELGRIPAEEILAARVNALVYREYLDADYTVPNTAPLIAADINEPEWQRRVPGAVIWTTPGERLYIHVLNGDPEECHSLHVHGLHYGIDSDGAWPRGVASKDGRRSDEILPGQSWTYVFDVTEKTIGAWPFHDHVHHVQANINRGLFGGIIVRDPKAPRVDHEVPLFMHAMAGDAGHCKFESPTLFNGNTHVETFPDLGEVCNYICRIHGASMAGIVRTVTGAPAAVNVSILDNKFVPNDVSVAPGGKVTWKNNGANEHVVFAGGGGRQSFCLNGRAFVGNTPTIAGNARDTLRWYLFNLDVGSVWHNFHPHATCWQIPSPPGGASDVHALSPVETFIVDSVIPDALHLPCELAELQNCPPKDACQVTIKGDFLFHCHIEEHMMSGLAGLIRARQKLWVTEKVLKTLNLQLPFDHCYDECGPVDLKRCLPHKPPRVLPQSPVDVHTHAVLRAQEIPEHTIIALPDHHVAANADGHHPDPLPVVVPSYTLPSPLEAASKGYWELLPCELPVLAVHAAVMHTGKVLFFAGSGNDELYTTGLRSAVYDYENGTFQLPVTPIDVFCAGQAFMPDGRVLVAGGTKDYAFTGLQTALLFDPMTEQWTFVQSMQEKRWYPTLTSLGDGQVLVVSGGGAVKDEIYNNATGWTASSPPFNWPLFPHLHLLMDGRVFHSGMRFGGSGVQPGFLNTTTGTYTALPAAAVPPSFQFGARDQGATVLLPPAQEQRVMVMGGGSPSINAVHSIKLNVPNPAYVAMPPMLRPRVHVNAVILPDRTVVATGGSAIGESAATASLEAEIFDPATNTWHTGAAARVPRMYHSVAVLLPDGRVLTAGSNPSRRNDELRLELYHPPYLFRGPRPCIEQAPKKLKLGECFTLHTPNAVDIKWISLVAPMATTHSYDSAQRLVDIPFKRDGACKLKACMVDCETLAPPGHYMLFLVDHKGVPSVASWVQVVADKVKGCALKHGDIVVGTSGKIVQVHPSTGALTVITQGALGNVEGIAFEKSGDLAVVTDGGQVVRVAPHSGGQTLVHSSGKVYQDIAVKPDGDYAVVNLPSATSSGLFNVKHDTGAETQINTGHNFGDGPTGVVIGPDGHYYVAELGKRAVIRVDKTTGAETVVSQGGHFVSPSGIAVGVDGHFYVVDHGSDKVIHLHPGTGVQKVVSEGGHLAAPVDIAVEPSGKLLVVDLIGDKLIRIDPATGAQSIVAAGGVLARIRSVAVVGGG